MAQNKQWIVRYTCQISIYFKNRQQEVLKNSTFEGHIMEMGLNNKTELLSSLVILHNIF